MEHNFKKGDILKLKYVESVLKVLSINENRIYVEYEYFIGDDCVLTSGFENAHELENAPPKYAKILKHAIKKYNKI